MLRFWLNSLNKSTRHLKTNGCIRTNKIFFFHLLSKSESVKFLLIESVICLYTDSSVKKYFSLLNQLIFTEIISKI